ncbi:MAG: FadR family transcriptional regulator [Anaerolineales bacterium]|nr:FadR family transcriptional regulator [Anaerolineales bacterium]
MEGIFDLSIRRDRLYEQVADQLQELIVAESLRPGDKLPSERELAERLVISRTVVREAIQALSIRGLVKVKPGCGAYVCQLTPEDAAAPFGLLLKLRQSGSSVDHLYEVRQMIEVEIAGLAAERASEQDQEALGAAIRGMETHADNPSRFAEYDMAFHAALAQATGNELFSVLMDSIGNLWQEMILVSYHAPGAPDDGIGHHRAVLECIRNHDVEAARCAMRRHVQHSQRLVEAVNQRIEAPEGE